MVYVVIVIMTHLTHSPVMFRMLNITGECSAFTSDMNPIFLKSPDIVLRDCVGCCSSWSLTSAFKGIIHSNQIRLFNFYRASLIYGKILAAVVASRSWIADSVNFR